MGREVGPKLRADILHQHNNERDLVAETGGPHTTTPCASLLLALARRLAKGSSNPKRAFRKRSRWQYGLAV